VLTFGGNIIQTGTSSYRLARTRSQIIGQRETTARSDPQVG